MNKIDKKLTLETGSDASNSSLPTNETRRNWPPREFTNKLNDLRLPFDFKTWRSTNEWKLFVAGYNAAVLQANDSIKAKYNLGKVADQLFGG